MNETGTGVTDPVIEVHGLARSYPSGDSVLDVLTGTSRVGTAELPLPIPWNTSLSGASRGCGCWRSP